MRVPIPDFPTYTVDDKGNVYSKRGRLKLEKTHSGYLRVTLCNRGVKERFYVHRLIASVFIPNPENLPQINHKDENKGNNRVDNLEWCTPRYNMLYSDVPSKGSNARKRGVICTTTGESFDSIIEACTQYGLFYANIIACCRGRRFTTGGKKWRYSE